MIIKTIKLIILFVMILIIFAFLPTNLLEKLKNYLDWSKFINILKIGFDNLINFLKEVIDINLNKINNH